ncbi:MAG: DNA-binding protein [Phycisphaerae bacterium]
MSTAIDPEVFLSLRRTAARLGVPASWLRAEALAGRVPHLRAGRRLLFNPTAVEGILLDRAAGGAKGIAHAGMIEGARRE